METGSPAVGAAGTGRARAARLFDAHGAELLRYLARRVGRDAAEDLVSDVFAVMVSDDRGFDPARGGERAWLFGIATNLARRHHRDLVRSGQAMTRAAATLAAVVPSHAGEVDDRIDARRHVEVLLDALRGLPDDDRDVLLLVAWGGLTSAEAGEALGIPAGTARSRLHRVRRELRGVGETTDPSGPPEPSDPSGPPEPSDQSDQSDQSDHSTRRLSR